MKQIVKVYKDNIDTIEHFIQTTIERLQIKTLDDDSSSRIFNVVGCSRLIYFVDDDYILQSAYYMKKGSDSSKKGISKKHYFSKVVFDNNNTYLSNPYISARTGKAGITYTYKVNGGYIVIDFDLLSILENLHLVHSNKIERMINTFAYGLMGFSLVFFAIFLSIYAIYVFIESTLLLEHFSLQSTFKAIIALTLGLAIYDLAKTILEHEIFFRNISSNEKDENEILSKFLKSIIIALSIEALMVVFKVALNDFTDMLYALYLIIGVSLMIFALGKYNFYTKNN